MHKLQVGVEAGVGQQQWREDREYLEKLGGEFSQVQRPVSPVAAQRPTVMKLSS